MKTAERQECNYCGRMDLAVRMSDRTCEATECQAKLHRSYGEEAFLEFCERDGSNPEDWEEFFAEEDYNRIDARIQERSQTAMHALQDLINVLEDEHKIVSSIIELQGIRYTRSQLQEALVVVKKASNYRARRP